MAIVITVLLWSGSIILLFAALHDLAFRTVPNCVVIMLFLLASLMRALHGTLIFGMVISLLVLFGAAICWRRGWLGGGDVKLLAACAMLAPPTLRLLLDVALAGGVLAVVYLALGRLLTSRAEPRPRRLLRRVCRIERYRIRRRRSLPYASAIAAGTLFVMLTE